jgi:hypothetical protein
MRLFLKLTFAFALMMAAALPVHADVVAWQLENVGFDDGGQVSGWFTVDNATHTFLNWSISVGGK